MKLVTVTKLVQLAATAAGSERLRTNHNLHDTFTDPVQRLVNAIAPGSYVRPHRHCDPPRWELFLGLAGSAVVLSFDTAGTVLERAVLGPGEAAAVEIPAGTWHTVASCEPGTVLFEVKPGPYQPLTDGDFADWAPAAGVPGCAGLVSWFLCALPGERFLAAGCGQGAE